MTPLAIVDRDGTIIDVVRDAETGTVHTAFHPSHLRLLDGAVEGLCLLVEHGFALAIATNQPGPAKGQIPREAVQRTNDALVERLAREGVPIARVETCLHHPDGGEGGEASLVGPCECRKPKPGLLLAAMAALGASREATWMIGDTASDVQAARAAGVRSALVFPAGRCEICPLRGGPSVVADLTAPRLDLLARAILSGHPA